MRLSQSQAVVLDTGQGRSAYLCPQASCLQQAQKKNRLGRALKAPIPTEVWLTLNQRLSDQAGVEQEPSGGSGLAEP